MRALLQNLADGIDWLNGRVGGFVSWFNLIMVVITFSIVVLRYGFGLNWIWLQESVTYMHALVFMVGAAYTFREDAHVRVDIFYRSFSERTRAIVNLLGGLLFLLPLVVFLLWVSWDYVLNAWGLMEGSREAGGLPLVYLMKTYILLMAVLLLLQAVASMARSMLVLTEGRA